MATQEKLLKSLESLKHLLNSNLSSDGAIRKKEKIQHCNFIAEAISTSTIKIASNFNYLLGFTFEILLQLCDDMESDVRMIADECMNRIIRAMNNGNIGKVQIELHKEIKKNGAARSLKAALWRFSQLAHQIRPHKGKPYVVNLIPCIVKISERNEEMIHETLANSLPNIMQILGCFMNDNDIKTMLRAFLNNISNPSAVIRRTTSGCILSVCLHCRKPYVFLTYVLNNIIDMLVPVDENSSLILGTLGGLKIILPHIKNKERQEMRGSFGIRKDVCEIPVAVDKLLQVYELCLLYLASSDHNIVNAALETLNVLIQNCQPELKSALLSEEGITHSRVGFLDQFSGKENSPRQMSIISTQTSEENLLADTELTDTIGTDIEKWIDDSKLSVINVNYITETEKPTDSVDSSMTALNFENVDASEYSNISIGNITDNYTESVRSESIVDNMDKFIMSENSSEKSFYQSLEEKSSTTTITDVCYQDVDIGSFKDKNIPLIYCTRLIVKSFLLSGQSENIIPDKKVRVSVKNLALTCLSSIFQIYPVAFLLYLDKSAKENCRKQLISDILLFENHADPQLRGIVRILIASFIKAVLINNEGNYKTWITKRIEVSNTEVFEMQKMMKLILKGLEDDSSTCTRQSLISLSICLKYVIESQSSYLSISILNILPILAKNPYWLVKVKLLEVISDLQYITIHHVTGDQEFQNKVIYNILFHLLKDDDQRVRIACSTAIVNIIPNLYYEQNMPNQNAVTNKAIYFKSRYLTDLHCLDEIETNISKKIFVGNMPFPYNACNEAKNNSIDLTLSRIIGKLSQFLLTSTSKHFIYGCLETLYLLSSKYPSTVYKSSWNCYKNYRVQQESNIFQRSTSVNSNLSDILETSVSSSNDLLNITVTKFMDVVVYDFNCHINLLKFSGNIFAGKCIQNLQLVTDVTDLEATKPLWDMFTDKNLQELCEQFLNHVVKLLNIFCHIIDEVIPIVIPVKPTLPNLPSATSLSPLKRRKSDLDKSKLLSLSKATEKEEKSEKKSEVIKSNGMGYFANIPHYMKIYELLRTAYLNYKITLDTEASENLIGLLRTTLHTLSQILEIATLSETGRIAEEILYYLRSTFQLEPMFTVQCVHQLLKSLFGTNLSLSTDVLNFLCKIDGNEEAECEEGFYYNVSQKPYNDVSGYINSLMQANKIECTGDSTVMGYLHHRETKKTTSKGSDKILANYIRIFEPMVIKSLKQYTITSNVKLQCEVLQLLSQLVQLRVNYCLLDSEQIFIGFVLKQFEFIEEGQMQLVSELVPKIFQFLVHLSYGKQHSKSIISVPKIIQLCDGLMASGQAPLTHCVPALEPIVEDIFLTRNKSNTADFKELETTREVLLSMMLRLLEYPHVVDLLVLIINESKYCDNTEKWSKWSKQVFDVLLTVLKHNKIRLDDRKCVSSIMKLIYVLNPQVFKTVNEVLVILFQESPSLHDSLICINRWLGKVIVLMLMLTQTKEEILLMKISECLKDFSPRSIFENVVIKPDPLNVTNTSSFFEGIPSEIIFLRFIFRTIDLVSKKCLEVAKNEEDDFLIKQLSHFLMICLYIFQSGSHCKITNVAIKVTQDGTKQKDKIDLEGINNNFLKFAFFFPTLTFKWCYFLTVLNYSNRKFWAAVININETYGIIRHIKEPSVNYEPHCINLEIVRIGGTIAFCEYLTENIVDAEQLSWFLINSIELIVTLCEEPPVAELLASIHRSSAASGLVIQAISSKCLENIKPVFLTKILKCVENVHSSQSGTLLALLIPRFLNLEQLAISRMVANVASRKIEYLLTLTMEEVTNQLPKDDLISIMESLISMKLAKKNETLVSLLNRLTTQFYDLSPLELDQRRAINPEYIKKLQINKNWYITQIKMKCHLISCSVEVAKLLSILEYDDLIPIMSSKDFNRLILKDCITFCVNSYNINPTKDEPQLLKASVNILLTDIAYIRNLLPKPHQVYRPTDRDYTQAEQKYSHRLSELFVDEAFYTYLSNLVPPVTCYIRSLGTFTNLKIPDNNLEDLIRFGIVCLESVNYIVSARRAHVNINFVDIALTCANVILRNGSLSNILSLNTHISWLCSAVNSIYKLLSYALLNFEPLPSLPKNSIKNTLQNVDTMCAGHACYQLSVLISWLEKSQKSGVHIPNFLLSNIKSIIVCLSRQLPVNSFVLTPPNVWKNGWTTELTGVFNTSVLPLPVDYLQDIDVLEEFIYRHMLLGWINRQQFEETWMCLLSVLNANPNEANIPDEMNAFTHATSLAIRAITSLLLLTLYNPYPGNKTNSKLIHISRDTAIEDKSASVRKLKIIQDRFERKFNENSQMFKDEKSIINVFSTPNLEKHNSGYSCGQISIKYLLISSKIVDIVDENSFEVKLYKKREQILDECGLDLNSCLQFLLDLYSQWIKCLSTTPLRILNEVVKSILIISDLFVEKSQYLWMLESCLELSKMHVVEDDIIHQYLIICVCKAAAVINPDMETYDSVKKILTQGLKSVYLSARIGSLHGILYLLQGCLLTNTVIGGISDEMQLFLPIAIEYVQCHLISNNGVLTQSQNHTLLLWSLSFFIIENVNDMYLDSGFTLMVIQAALTLLNTQKHIIIHNAVLKGLERLVIKKCLSSKMCDQIMKLSIEKIKDSNPVYALPAVQLLISCMYTECSQQLENTEKSNGVVQSNPDHLVQTIEKVSAIFDKIKKGYPFEVEILCHILPNILNDFFPPSDILTKVVGEFLSPQQRHSKLLSRVLFQVFESAIQQSQLSLLQDWVVFSLTNFTQSFSVGMATWCLTCFFISASTNNWLRSVFPYVQSRIGRYEYEDRKMLCIAGVDFYKNLTTDKQRQTFIDSFQKVKEESDMPFNDLLASL